MIASPWFALILCTMATLIAVPGGTIQDVVTAGLLAVRLLMIMLISAVLGCLATPNDFIGASRQLRLPENVGFGISATARFLPLAVKTMRAVTMAQRSRGLSFGFRALFRAQTYQALVVPYILSVLRSAVQLWVAMSLRPLRGIQISVSRPRALLLAELALLGLSGALWVPFPVSIALLTGLSW